jgi:hypothetical protein
LEVLKYDVSESGILDEKTKTQVRNFQRKHGLTVDGAPGSETIKKIVEVWDSTSKNVASTVEYSPLIVSENESSSPEKIVYDFSDIKTDWDKVSIDVGKRGAIYFNGVKSISPQDVSEYYSSNWGEKNLCFPDVKFLSNEVLEKLAKSPYNFYFNNLDVVTSTEAYDKLQRYKDKIFYPEDIKISELPQNFAKNTISKPSIFSNDLYSKITNINIP